MGDIEDNISQCTFLQKTYTAENPQADGSATPGTPKLLPAPPSRTPRHVPRTHDNRMAGRQCPVMMMSFICSFRNKNVVSKRPLDSISAAKMSPHIRIGPDPVLTAHAPSPPAAGSHCPAREDSAPHCRKEFFQQILIRHYVSMTQDGLQIAGTLGGRGRGEP